MQLWGGIELCLHAALASRSISYERLYLLFESTTDSSSYAAMKTEFMQLWDGMESHRGSQVLVLGATNRKAELDPAVLRRFTLHIKVPRDPSQQE